MAAKELQVGEIVSGGIKLGMQNFLPLFLNALLFGLTFWIPYLNIGTFIAVLGGGLVLPMSKGKTISSTELFNPLYRKYFGEFFLQMGLMMIGIYASMITLIGPYILQIAWGLAPALMLDGKAEPGVAALKKSNELTYGNKMTIFLANMVLGIILSIAFLICALIMNWVAFLGVILLLGVFSCLYPIMMGMNAYIYQQLAGDEPGEQGSADTAADTVDEFAQ